MRVTSFTLDVFGVLFFIACILLAVGVIPFTPVAVALLLIGSQCSLSFTWR